MSKRFRAENLNDRAEKLRRFFKFVTVGPRGCWLWSGNLDKDGYAKFCVDRWNVRAARWAYQTFVGPIADGLQVDHLCRARACVNPAHLEPVTPRENALRGEGPAAANARKTHCRKGHEFTPLNTYEYVRHGRRGRWCKTCIHDRAMALDPEVRRARQRETQRRIRESRRAGIPARPYRHHDAA